MGFSQSSVIFTSNPKLLFSECLNIVRPCLAETVVSRETSRSPQGSGGAAMAPRQLGRWRSSDMIGLRASSVRDKIVKGDPNLAVGRASKVLAADIPFLF